MATIAVANQKGGIGKTMNNRAGYTEQHPEAVQTVKEKLYESHKGQHALWMLESRLGLTIVPTEFCIFDAQLPILTEAG